MNDRLTAGQTVVHRRLVEDVATDTPPIQTVDAMDLGASPEQARYIITGGAEQADDLGADETVAAGDKHAHGAKKPCHRNMAWRIIAVTLRLLRHPSDRRSLIWAALPAGVLCAVLAWPDFAPFLCLLSCGLFLGCGVIAHNHSHCRTFHSRIANEAFSAWLSIFYGYPVFAWVPTHNHNHHRFNNRPGDDTATWLLGNRHDWKCAASYSAVSAWRQSGRIRAYIAAARAGNPALYRRILLQYSLWGGAHVAIFSVAVWLHGGARGLLLWAYGLGLPSLFSLWAIMLISFEQHVHADAWSPRASARNFTGGFINFLLFNNGFHTAHHEYPGLHWSRLPAAHAGIADTIPSSLLEPNFAAYFFRQYLWAAWNPSHGTRQEGSPPWLTPPTSRGKAR